MESKGIAQRQFGVKSQCMGLASLLLSGDRQVQVNGISMFPS
jgi:hypothetical protein